VSDADRPLLVTGASGLLGLNLAVAAVCRPGKVVGVVRSNPVYLKGMDTVVADLTDRDEARRLVESVRPSWIVHCAAATNVDWCERNPAAAYRANAEATGWLAAAARRADAGFVYVSTDSVFAGGTGDYREDDPPAPVNVYARSKVAGERAVTGECDRHLILRTNLFGWGLPTSRSLAEWVLATLEGGGEVPGFRDVVFNPLLVNDIAEMLLLLTENGTTGTLHLGSADYVSKYEFARQLAEVFGFAPERVRATSADEADFDAPRPRNTTLRTERAATALGRPMPSVREGLERCRTLRDQGHPARLRTFATQFGESCRD
jgi:dTDP-4-dehydrorhamnose reductase